MDEQDPLHFLAFPREGEEVRSAGSGEHRAAMGRLQRRIQSERIPQPQAREKAREIFQRLDRQGKI